MANGNVTPLERRDYITELDSYSEQFPQNLRALIQLWRSNQAAQLDLSALRSRYVHLQQLSDTQKQAGAVNRYRTPAFVAQKPQRCQKAVMERHCHKRKSSNDKTCGTSAAGG